MSYKYTYIPSLLSLPPPPSHPSRLSQSAGSSPLCYIVTPTSDLSYTSVQFTPSVVSDSLRPHELQHARLSITLSITNSWSLLKLLSIESVMPSNHLILCCPLLLPSSIFPSIRVFSNESVLHIKWPKYWSFSFSISPSSEYSGLISFRMDWLDLLAVQGTLRVFSNTTVQKHQFLSTQLSIKKITLTSIHDYWKIDGSLLAK